MEEGNLSPSVDPAFVEGRAVDDMFPLGGEQHEDYGVESDINVEHVSWRAFSPLVQVVSDAAEALCEYHDIPDCVPGQ